MENMQVLVEEGEGGGGDFVIILGSQYIAQKQSKIIITACYS